MLLCSEFERSVRSAHPALATSPLSAAIVDSVLEYIRIRHGSRIDPEIKVLLPAALRKALIYLRGNLSRDIRMANLVAASGVSERSLFNQFDEFLDMTPMRYLEAKRLEFTRGELLGDAGSVAEIARRAGFRHMGRFSFRYRKGIRRSPVTDAIPKAASDIRILKQRAVSRTMCATIASRPGVPCAVCNHGRIVSERLEPCRDRTPDSDCLFPNSRSANSDGPVVVL